MKRSLLVVALVSLFVAVPVSANQTTRRDPNDTRGPLDIRRISHGHRGNRIWHKVVMRSSWGKNALRGNDDIRFEISTDGEDRFDEVNVAVDLHDGKLKAWIFPYVEGSDHAGVGPSERIRLTRPNRYSVKVFFNRSWVDNRGRYAWSVDSSYKNRDSRHCGQGCHDQAPNRGRVEHNL